MPGGGVGGRPDLAGLAGHGHDDPVVGGGRAGAAGGAVVVEDVDDDDADVVAPAALVGQAHQFAGGLGGIGQLAERGGDPILVDLVEQSVGAEDVAVAGDRQHLPGVDHDPGVDAERPRDDVALRVHGGLGRGEPTLALERGDQAVVVGDLLEHVLLQEVDPGVADVDDGEAVLAVGLDDPHGAQRGAHPRQLGVAGGGGDDLVVGLLDRGGRGRRWSAPRSNRAAR